MKLYEGVVVGLMILIVILFLVMQIPKKNPIEFPLHEDIAVTIFWVGEEASQDNAFIQNRQSAWDSKWVEHFGGTDDPDHRNGYHPKTFTPLENPFYFALPYSDFNSLGERRDDSNEVVYWLNGKKWSQKESMLKNRWIKISKDNKVAYAQWEDVGPFEVYDYNYVFGEASPKNKVNENAGLDVSPAVRDFLGLDGIDKVDWQFVNSNDVPDGPWKEIVTESQIYWE